MFGLNIVIVCFETNSKFYIYSDFLGIANHVAVSIIAQQLVSCKTEVPAAYNTATGILGIRYTAEGF